MGTFAVRAIALLALLLVPARASQAFSKAFIDECRTRLVGAGHFAELSEDEVLVDRVRDAGTPSEWIQAVRGELRARGTSIFRELSEFSKQNANLRLDGEGQVATFTFGFVFGEPRADQSVLSFLSAVEKDSERAQWLDAVVFRLNKKLLMALVADLVEAAPESFSTIRSLFTDAPLTTARTRRSYRLPVRSFITHALFGLASALGVAVALEPSEPLHVPTLPTENRIEPTPPPPVAPPPIAPKKDLLVVKAVAALSDLKPGVYDLVNRDERKIAGAFHGARVMVSDHFVGSAVLKKVLLVSEQDDAVEFPFFSPRESNSMLPDDHRIPEPLRAISARGGRIEIRSRESFELHPRHPTSIIDGKANPVLRFEWSDRAPVVVTGARWADPEPDDPSYHRFIDEYGPDLNRLDAMSPKQFKDEMRRMTTAFYQAEDKNRGWSLVYGRGFEFVDASTLLAAEAFTRFNEGMRIETSLRTLDGVLRKKYGDIVVKEDPKQRHNLESLQLSPQTGLLLVTSTVESARYTENPSERASIYQYETGKLLFNAHFLGTMRGNFVWRLSSKGMVAAVSGKTLRLWDAPSKKEIELGLSFNDKLVSVEFSKDGKRLIVGSDRGYAMLVDIETKKIVATLKHEGDVKTISLLAFSPDGSRIATAGNDGKIHFWTAEGKRVGLIDHGDEAEVLSLQFHPENGVFLAITGTPRRGYMTTLVSLRDGKEVASTSAGGTTVVRYAPDGSTFLTIAYGRVKVWKMR